MEEKIGKASQAGEAPGPVAQVIGALDEDKSETCSPIEGSYEVEITGASERTSELSMKERLEKEKREMTTIKVEPQAMDLDDPLNKPMKIVLPGWSKLVDVPHTSPAVTPPSKKGTKGKRGGEGSSEKTTEVKKAKKHKK